VINVPENIIVLRKPQAQNTISTRLFYNLWVYTKSTAYEVIPEANLRAVITPEILKREDRV